MVRDFVVGGLASARAVTSSEERELGVLVLDIGGGTTDIAVISRGVLCHLAVISLGGGHLTFDLAAGLRTPIVAAERLKCSYGAAFAQTVYLDDVVEVASTGVRPPRLVSRKTLVQLLEPRVRELLEIVKAEMVSFELLKIAHAGVVLSGGGAQLSGIDTVAEQVLGLPVRIGSFSEVSSSSENVVNPVFSACVGAGLEAGSAVNSFYSPSRAYSPFTNSETVPFTKWIRHIGDWLGQHF
jgi:cell division protein FtsA